MYQDFYGLSGKPFSLLPDSDFMFLSKRHRRAINLLEYGIMTEAGFLVISGDVGAGKTTIIRRYLQNVGSDVKVGVITNPSKTIGRLLDWVMMAYELEDGDRDVTKLYHRFVEFLLAEYAAGRRTVLIIDEAQNLSADQLEELRMLSNVNNEKDQLLQIVLVGQPELLEVLNKPELRQFVQRISVHCNLDPLTPSETAGYVRHRLGVVGGKEGIFDDIACAAVHFFTGGVPRLINLLCDQSLVYGFSDEHAQISGELVAEVALDRNKTGLSAFTKVGDDWQMTDLIKDVTSFLDEIRASQENA